MIPRDSCYFYLHTQWPCTPHHTHTHTHATAHAPPPLALSFLVAHDPFLLPPSSSFPTASREKIGGRDRRNKKDKVQQTKERTSGSSACAHGARVRVCAVGDEHRPQSVCKRHSTGELGARDNQAPAKTKKKKNSKSE